MPVKGRRALPNQMLGWVYIGFMDAWSVHWTPAGVDDLQCVKDAPFRGLWRERRKEGTIPISAEKMKLYPGGSIKSPEWQAIRERIRARAGNCCEKCGVENHVLGGRLRSGKFLKAQPMGDNGLRLVWPKPGEEWWCGDQEQIRLRIIKIVCTVAHFDNHLTDHSDDNLRFWCQQCHLRHDAKQHAASARLNRRRKAPQIDIEDWIDILP